MADRDAAARAVADLLAALGIELADHTARTPQRVAAAWVDAVAGYDCDPADHLAVTFPGPDEPGLVVVSGIRVVSTCAHHLLPITGTATVAYRPRPGQRIVGLSKLARVVEGYARRLQVQERLGDEVTTALVDRLDPIGAGCVITATHGCMTLRGVAQPDATTTTAAWARWPAHDPDPDRVLAEHHRTRGGGWNG